MENTNRTNIFEALEKCHDEFLAVSQELHEKVPQHRHRQGHILVVLDGVASMDIGKNTYLIPYGHFVWIPPEVYHRISFDGESINILNIYFPNSVSRDPMFDKVGAYPIPSLLYHVLEMVKDCKGPFGKEDWHYELLETTMHILPHIIQEDICTLRLPTSDNPAIVRILDVIHRKYSSPQLTLQQVSHEIGMSERSVNRYMHAELGVTFTQYLRTYRIMTAIRKMVESGDNIGNIAYEVGYESLTAFSNTFRKITGVRPSLFFQQPDTEWPE